MLTKTQPHQIVKTSNQLSPRSFLTACIVVAALLAAPAVQAGTTSITFGFQKGNLTTNTVAYGSGSGYTGVVDGRITDNTGTSALSTGLTSTIGNQFQSAAGTNGQQQVGLFSYDLTELNNFIAANTGPNSSASIASVSMTIVSAGGNSGGAQTIALFGTDPFTSGSCTWSNYTTATTWTVPFQNLGAPTNTAPYCYTGGGSALTASLAGSSPNTGIGGGTNLIWTSSANFINAVTNALGRADKTIYLTARVNFLSNSDNRLNVINSATNTVAFRPQLQITLTVTTTSIWTGGGGNTSWTTANNWLSNTVPTTGDAIIFNAASTANLATVLNQNFSITSLSVTNPSGPVSIGGANTLTNGSGGIDLSAANQNLTITAPMVLGAAQSWNVTNGRTLSVNGGISGGVALTVAGTGTVSLGGAASHTGATTVNSGATLRMGAANVLPNGAGAGNLILNGTLDLNGTSQAINGLSGGGALDNVAGGGASILTVGTITNNAASSFSGLIQNTSGTLALVYIGTNSLTLTGTNTFSGGFTNNGTGFITTGSAAGTNYIFGTGPLVLNAGVFYPTAQNYTFTNALTLNGATLQVGGAGSHLLTWSGPVRVTADSFLSCDGGTAGITLSGAVTNAGFTLACIGAGTASTLSGVVSGNGTIMPNAGTTTLNLNAANTFSGTNRAALGTLKIGHANALQNATLDMNAADSGTVNLNNLNAVIGALNGSRNLALGSGAISIGNNNLSTTYSGVLSGGSLAKIGIGTLTLSRTNTYAGSTTVSNGVLALGTNNALPSATTVNLAGGTLAMGTFTNTVNAFQSSGSILAKGTWGASGSGANHISGSMTGAGILTVTTGGASTISVTSGGASTYGGSVTFTATITGSSGNGSTPAGTVTFYDGGIAIGTGSLSGAGLVATATLTTSALTAATHSITASFGGNASYDVSASANYSQVVSQATSTATLTVNNSPATYNGVGQSATVSLTASNTPGSVVNILTGGAASQINSGTYAVTADFVPADTNYTTLTGLAAGNFVINKATTTATLAVNNSPVTYNGLGQAATVIITSSNTPGAVVNLQTGGAATQTNAGTYAVTANYVPADTNYTTLTGLSAGNFVIAQATTSVGASSTQNPSGYKDAVSFLATLPAAASGSVVFASTNAAISTNNVSGGSATSLSITNLPRGTNVITFAYSGDGNYSGTTNLLNQVVTNHPPVANVASYSRNAALNTYKISVTNLLTNASDADDDTLTLVTVGGSTNGALVMIGGGYVFYYNTNAVADQFTYTVGDGFGGTNSATVSINTDPTPLFGQSQLASVSGGTATLNFAGIPGYSYSVIRSTNVTFVPLDIIWTTNAPVGGLFDYTDTSAPTPSAFYRLQYNP